jgi:hypothetical protein
LAGIVAVICADWISLGAIVVAVPFGGVNTTDDPAAKFPPEIVTAVEGLYAGVLFGVTERMVPWAKTAPENNEARQQIRPKESRRTIPPDLALYVPFYV